jgi:hypothetical protein
MQASSDAEDLTVISAADEACRFDVDLATIDDDGRLRLGIRGLRRRVLGQAD